MTQTLTFTLTAATMAATMTVPVSAQVPMSGRFTAEATCAATVSIREPAKNPGFIAVEAGRSYELLGRNAVPGSHYLIRVDGAEPERRWVAYGCGRVEDDEAEGVQSAATAPSRTPARSDRYLLAASWHPAFCDTRARRAECRDGGEDGGFTLHGLWPQPRGREYCNVPEPIVEIDRDGDWLDLPPPRLSSSTRANLAAAMPGTVAGLDRHEWWKHGTCHGGDAETYFQDSLRLLEALNGSDVAELFVASIGDELSAREIRAAFDAAFGRGAGRRVLVDCTDGADGRALIGELRIELSGVLSPETDLGSLMLAADPVAPGCPSGEVDRPG